MLVPLLFQLFWENLQLLPGCGSVGRLGSMPPAAQGVCNICMYREREFACVCLGAIMDLCKPGMHILVYYCLN